MVCIINETVPPSKFKVFNTLKCQSPFSSILMELGGPCLLPSEGGDVSCWCGEDDICGFEGSHPGGWCGNTAGLSSANRAGSDTRLSWPLVHRLSWAKLSQHKHEHSPEPGPSTALCDRFSQLENICNCENILQKCTWKLHINCDKTAHMFGCCYDEDGDNNITVKWHHWLATVACWNISMFATRLAWLIVDK